MADFLTNLAALQGELPDSPHTYKPLTPSEYDALESQIYRMGPQIDGTPAWPREQMLAWLQQQTPQHRGIAIAMMRRAYRPERVGLPREPQPVFIRKPAPKSLPPSPQSVITLHSVDGRPIGKTHTFDSLIPVTIDISGNIHSAKTGRTLWIAPGSHIDLANPGAAERLNPTYQPALHRVVADHRQDITSGE